MCLVCYHIGTLQTHNVRLIGGTEVHTPTRQRRPLLQVGSNTMTLVEFSTEAVDAFNTAIGEIHPLHRDAAFAATTPFGRRVVSGVHVWQYITSLLHLTCGPEYLSRSQTCTFRRPVYEGDSVAIRLIVAELQRSKITFTLQVTGPEVNNAVVFVDGSIAMVRIRRPPLRVV